MNTKALIGTLSALLLSACAGPPLDKVLVCTVGDQEVFRSPPAWRWEQGAYSAGWSGLLAEGRISFMPPGGSICRVVYAGGPE